MDRGSGSRSNTSSLPAWYPRGAILLWSVAAALALLSLPLFALFDSLQGDLSQLRAAIMQAQMARVAPVPAEEAGALQATTAELAALEAHLQAVLARTSQGRVPWMRVLEDLLPVVPSHVRLTGLRQRHDQLTIQGIAQGDLALAAYVGHLRASALFADVQVGPTAEVEDAGALSFSVSLRLPGYQP